MQLRHAVYIYVMGIHHRYTTVTYKWTYGVDMHAVYAQKDGASAYKWSPVLHTNQFCIQMEPSDDGPCWVGRLRLQHPAHGTYGRMLDRMGRHFEARTQPHLSALS